jgi:hypothetical protein
MKHSAALNVKVGDTLAVNLNRDGILWEVTSINFPLFSIQEIGTNYKPMPIDYCYCYRPTKAQLNAHKKRKEKYYERRISTSTTNSKPSSEHCD